MCLLAGILLLIQSEFCRSGPVRSDPIHSGPVRSGPRFCQRPSDQARAHFHCLHHLKQPRARLKGSSRLPVNFNLLQFKHRSSCSILYSGSFSRIEPRTQSTSLKTEKIETNIMPHFPCDSYRLIFVCLSHLGVYDFMTSLVQSATASLYCMTTPTHHGLKGHATLKSFRF